MLDLSPKKSPAKRLNIGYFAYELSEESTGITKVFDSDVLEISSEFLEVNYQVDVKKISDFKKNFLMIANQPESAALEIKNLSFTENIMYQRDSSIWSKLKTYGVVFLREHQECRFKIQNVLLYINSVQRRSDLDKSNRKERVSSLGLSSPTTLIRKASEKGISEKTPNGKNIREISSPMRFEHGAKISCLSEEKHKDVAEILGRGLITNAGANKVIPSNEQAIINNRISAGNHHTSALSQNTKECQKGRRLLKNSASSTSIKEPTINKNTIDTLETFKVLNYTSTQKSNIKDSSNSVLDFFNINLDGNISTEASSLPQSENASSLGQRFVGRVSSFFSDLALSEPESQKESKGKLKRKSKPISPPNSFKGAICETNSHNPVRNKKNMEKSILKQNEEDDESDNNKISYPCLSYTQQEEHLEINTRKKKRKLENDKEAVIINISKDKERLTNEPSFDIGGKLCPMEMSHEEKVAERKLRRLKKKREENLRKSPRSSQEDSCAICLGELASSQGVLPCSHKFCFSCIKDWADVTNLCPLCKREFISISKKNNEESSFEEEIVKVKKKKQKSSEGLEEESDCDDFCYVCSSGENPELLLICDKCNFYICHTFCANLTSIPDDDWYCQYCEFEELESSRNRQRIQRTPRQQGQRLGSMMAIRVNTNVNRPNIVRTNDSISNLDLDFFLYPRRQRQSSVRVINETARPSESRSVLGLYIDDEENQNTMGDFIETFVYRR